MSFIPGGGIYPTFPTSGGAVDSVSGSGNIVATPTTGAVVVSTVAVPSFSGLNDATNATLQGVANYILQTLGSGLGYRWIPPPMTNYFSLPTDATIGTTPNTTITATSTYPRQTWNAGMLIQGTCYFSGTADRTINHTIAYAQVVLYRGTGAGTILATHKASCPPNTGGAATVEYWSCPITFYDTGASTSAPQQYTLSITFVQSTGPVLNPLLLSNSTLCVLNGQ
jgi:hypothetical protein